MRTPLLAATLLLSTTACAGVHGSGTIVRSQKSDLPTFTAIELAGGLEATVRQGPPGLVLEGDDNILSAYEVTVDGEVLKVHPRSGVSLSPSRPVTALITLPVLRKVDASGGVDVRVESGVEKELALELSGGVELHAGGLALSTLKLEASGGVKVELSGAAESADLSISGGVRLDAQALAAKSVALDASGGCNVDLRATDAISGEASGGVVIVVRGNPPKSRLTGSGGTSIRYKD